MPMATRSERRASGSALRGRAGGRPSRARRRCGRWRRCSPGCRRPRRRPAGRPLAVSTGAGGARRALEQGDDRLSDAEAGHRPADRRAAGEDVDAEAAGDRGHALGVDERGDRPAPGVEGPLDDEVALGEEPTRPRAQLAGRVAARTPATRGSAGSSTAITTRSEVVRARRTSPAGASPGRRRGPRPPRRCRRPAGWPRRRTAAGRRGRRRSG